MVPVTQHFSPVRVSHVELSGQTCTFRVSNIPMNRNCVFKTKVHCVNSLASGWCVPSYISTSRTVQRKRLEGENLVWILKCWVWRCLRTFWVGREVLPTWSIWWKFEYEFVGGSTSCTVVGGHNRQLQCFCIFGIFLSIISHMRMKTTTFPYHSGKGRGKYWFQQRWVGPISGHENLHFNGNFQL